MNSITIGLEPYTFAKVQRMRERTLAIFQVWNLMFLQRCKGGCTILLKGSMV